MAAVSATPIGPSSGLIAYQLRPLVDTYALTPPAATVAQIGSGAGPSNLPYLTDPSGAAANVSQGGGAMSPPSLASTASSLSALPFWQNPLVFTVVLLVLGWVILRYTLRGKG